MSFIEKLRNARLVRRPNGGYLVEFKRGVSLDLPEEGQRILAYEVDSQGNGKMTGPGLEIVRRAVHDDSERLDPAGLIYYPAISHPANSGVGPVDASGNGRNAKLNSGITAMQANANTGYFTTVGAASGHVITDFTFNFNTDLVIIAAVINAAAPGSLSWLMGNSIGGSATETGLALGCSVGAARLHVQRGGASVAAAMGGTICDGNDHTYVFAYNHRTRSIYQWVDGALIGAEESFVNASAGQCTRHWVFGNSSQTANPLAVKFKHVNLFKQTGGTLPTNMSEVAARYHTAPGNLLALASTTSKAIGVFVIGQSNEGGAGVTVGTNTAIGTPVQDPTKPNGTAGKRSFYPSMAAALGAAGYTSEVFNYAAGGTSVRDSWVGYLDYWTAGQFVKRGAWRISGGGIWKCGTANHINIPACTAAPVGTADTTGGDGIPWTYIGPYTGQHQLGIQRRGSALYDPNGLVDKVMSAMANYTGRCKVLHMAWGQTDSPGGVNASRADIAAAYAEIAAHALAVGADKVLLGVTIYAPGVTAWYESSLVPGVADAIATVNSPHVVAGVNMYAALGQLPTAPTTTDAGLGLQADALHGNDAVFDAGGRLLGASIIAALA